jgi:predicted O-methyltransferase YrrM
MATAAPQANIITIEGCPKISQRANRHFEQLNISNIELVSGDLNQTLPKVLSRLESIDLLFIDANHRFKPTIEYFMRCLPKFNEETVVILDDIHWSLGMERAWESLKNHPRVRLTADLYCAGILFFRSNLSKSHHILAW